MTNEEKIQRMLDALREIADRWDFLNAAEPIEEDYDDMESAYGNGLDGATYEIALIAQDALVAIGDREKVECKWERCYGCSQEWEPPLKTDQYGCAVCEECRPDLYSDDVS